MSTSNPRVYHLMPQGQTFAHYATAATVWTRCEQTMPKDAGQAAVFSYPAEYSGHWPSYPDAYSLNPI